jgi:signal transduction histidine kinase
VHASVTADERCVAVRVADDGIGFNSVHAAAGDAGHIGLRSVIERARAAGGDARIESGHGSGTTVTAWMCNARERTPVERREADAVGL